VFQYSLHHNITVSLISLLVLFSLVTAVHPFIPQCTAENLIKSVRAVGDSALNEVLNGKQDRFHGITVDSSKET
jgi:hypothetical protein